MNLKEILVSGFNAFFRWRKAKLVKAIVDLRDRYIQLERENAELRKRLEQEKVKTTNKEVNKPSSKLGEWEKGDPDKQGKKKKRGGTGNLEKVPVIVPRI